MIAQTRNDQMVGLLSGDLQRRCEPNLAWKTACSAMRMLPGLRGFWPMSSFNENGDAYDLSGQGRTLTYNGNPTYNYSSLIHYIDLDGTGDYLSRTDEAGLDILGTESYVAGAAQGLTLGGWFYFKVFPAFPTCLGKHDGVGGNQRSYVIWIDTGAGNVPVMVVSSNGTAVGQVTVLHTTGLVVDTWYFIVGRFVPSTSLTIFLDGSGVSNAAGIPASIFNSTTAFMIGARSVPPASFLNGQASLCFLCAAALSDSIISALFQQTRAIFNV